MSGLRAAKLEGSPRREGWRVHDSRRNEMARELRSQGLKWREIGEILGVTKEGAFNLAKCTAKGRVDLAHPVIRTPTYLAYHHMKSRCSNSKNKDYKFYGGRGITVCDRWLESFDNFLADMGEKPKGLEIDRTDNSKGYSPDNCRWVTHKENCRNFRRNRIIEHSGKTQTLIEWSEETGLDESVIRSRIKRGWTVEKALTTPSAGRPAKAAHNRLMEIDAQRRAA